MAAEFKVTSNASEYRIALADKRDKVQTAAQVALRDMADRSVDEIKREYSNRFSTSGFWRGFGSRWKSEMHETTAVISHPSDLAGDIERTGTATIHGKPLLWLPTTPGAPRAGRSGKKLVSATVRGQPMLFDADDPNRERKPLYVGVPTVRVQVGIHVINIIKKNLAEIDQAFHLED